MIARLFARLTDAVVKTFRLSREEKSVRILYNIKNVLLITNLNLIFEQINGIQLSSKKKRFIENAQNVSYKL